MPIQWKTDAQQQVYNKVDGYMKEMFGEMYSHYPEAPAFSISLGSTFATVSVYDWRQDDASITVRAYVVTEVEKTPELMEFLLKETAKLRFGAFGMDDDDDVFIEHTIVGSTCDKKELHTSVLSVLYTADNYDDQIMQRFGGLRAIDRKAKAPAAS